jgi:hypothetical protein
MTEWHFAGLILPPFPTGAIWLVKIVIETVLLVLLVWRGMAGKYVGLSVYLAVTVAKSITILVAMQDAGGYYPQWVRMQWISIAAYAILSIECLHLMCKHFRGIAVFATVLFTVFGTVSLAAGLLAGKIGVQWWSPEVRALAGWTRHYAVACALTILMARAFFWTYRERVKMATNVLRLATGTVLILAASTIGHAVKPWKLADLLVVGVPLIVFGWLCLRMRPAGEDAIIPPLASPEDKERWRREAEEAQRQLANRIRLRVKLET